MTQVRPGLHDAALAYAGAGLRVFPARRNKRPYIKGWRRRASSDPGQVATWWSRWPGANIVALTGTAAGFFVIDASSLQSGMRSWPRT